jgi:chemotaxis protein CheZ
MNLNDLPVEHQVAATDGRPGPDEVHLRIGQLTRSLHDSLRGLGYDKSIEHVRENLPDARDRLTYIARLTGDAAEKVLNAVDRAKVVQDGLAGEANGLHTRWQALGAYLANDAARATPAGATLVEDTCRYFDNIGEQSAATQAILTDIMMAQDFHDLTGQVIRKVVALAGEIEEQLLKLLIETAPQEEVRKAALPVAAAPLQGPVVNTEGRTDVVNNQADVDDLLASLGF